MGKIGSVPVLLADIGNTSVTYCLSRGGNLGKPSYCPTSRFPEIALNLTKNVSSFPNYQALVCSVVPEISIILMGIRGFRWAFVGREVKVPLKHRYRHIRKLGADRLVNAYAAVRRYKPPLLVLDFGTALTCDYISPKGVFEGGLIIPGPEVAWEALGIRAALLPRFSFPRRKRRTPFIGRDTRSGMVGGILQGYGALADELTHRFKRRYGKELTAVATGGLAQSIFPYTKQLNVLDPLLTLRGLAELLDYLQPGNI